MQFVRVVICTCVYSLTNCGWVAGGGKYLSKTPSVLSSLELQFLVLLLKIRNV